MYGHLTLPVAEFLVDSIKHRRSGRRPPTEHDHRLLPRPVSQDERDFRGTDRYELLDRLGSGGMGAVYRARDHHRDQVVALKTLFGVDPSGIYGLKKEFRALAKVVHHNLVAFYELVADEGRWFYTMELIDGVDFFQRLRPDDVDTPALRRSLPQLAAGINAVHRAGKLHRDLKPSNVLITPEDRVVILDFGIVADLASTDEDSGGEGEGFSGTAAYMAPEQAHGEASPASDWYAMGVMIYEVLTGQLPFSGSPLSIISQKLESPPPHPTDVAPDVPLDLADLCLDLMALRAEDRPEHADILQRLGTKPGRATTVPAPNTFLVGREQQLERLEEAHQRSLSGEPVFVCVHGPSGIGKTTLLRKFVDDKSHQESALVFTGLCYERENLPYKGVDAVIDNLSRFLGTLPEEDVRDLLPEDITLLCTIFPVLAQVPVIAQLSTRGPVIREPVELRRRAFLALRELLRRVATIKPLIVYIDDLQWGDDDSIGLLNELLMTVGKLRLLLIVAFPSEEIEATPFLRPLIELAREDPHVELTVGALTESESRQLASAFSTQDDGATDTFLEPIVREAAGSPLLVEQFARYAHALVAERGSDGELITLHDILEFRLRSLPEEARRLLETVAMAGRPIDGAVAWDAAELQGDERQTLKLLCVEHLLRFSGSVDRVEFCHSRLREAVLKRIPPERFPIIHGQLAGAMEARGIHDPEGYLEHWSAAGDTDRAALYAAEAADRAADALAFERSSVLYRRAIDLSLPEEDVDALRLKLGDALVNAGRGAEAAAVYLEAAENLPTSRALELRRTAAEQLLRSGHIDQGLEVIRTVLAASGLKLARTPRHALLRIIVRRLLIAAKGLGFKAQEEGTRDRGLEDRVDTCWAVTIGLARVDNIRGADFNTLHMLLAQKLGDPYRFVRALSTQAAFASTGGNGSRKKAEQFVRLATEWASKIQEPHAVALARLADGIAGFYVGEFARTFECQNEAERIFREECVGVAWEINTAQQYSLSSLYYMGEFRRLAQRAPVRLAEAIDRGDLYAAADVAAGRPIVAWLFADDPAAARDRFRETTEKWTLHGFHFQHYSSLLAQVQVDLYTDHAEAAWGIMQERWPELQGSMLLRIQQIRIEVGDLRARAALAAATRAGDDVQARIKSARQDAKRILREKTHWGDPFAHLILGGACAVEGDLDTALNFTREAIGGFEAVGILGHASVARRRYGQLIGGDEGQKLIRETDDWMATEGVANPARVTAMLAPGFEDPV
jgi:serine/threonine protein kinase